MSERSFSFESISVESFDAFSAEHPLSTFFQTSAMGKVSETNGWKSEFFGIFEDSRMIGATRLMSRKNHGHIYYYAIRGPLVDYEDEAALEFFIRSLRNYCKKNGGYELKIDPIIELQKRDKNGDIVSGEKNNFEIVERLKKLGFKHGGFFTGVPTRSQVRFVSELNFEDVLTKEELKAAMKDEAELKKVSEKLLASFKQNHRNLIRRTERTGIEVKELSKENLDTYLDIVHSTGDRRGFSVQNKKYFESFYDEFVAKNKAKFLVAYLPAKIENPDDKSGKMIPISTALFVMNWDEILYFTSGGYADKMKYYGQYAVQWAIIKWGLKNGYKKLNFYGISGIFDPKDSSYGVFQFKKGFGAVVKEYIGDFYMPLSWYYYLDKFISMIKK